MTHFDKTLNIKRLYFHYFPGVAITLILRRRYSAIALPLHRNRVAVTVKSRRDYGVTATRLERNGNGFWQKRRRRCQEGAPRSHFSALNAMVSKC